MSAAGRRMASDIVDELPPPDRLKRGSGGGGPEGDQGEEGDEEMGGEAAAKALMDALESKDPAAFASAFKDMMDTCRE